MTINVTNHTHLKELIYFDGPLLTLVKDKTTEAKYLHYWCDCDDVHNKYLVFRIIDTDLSKYMNRELSLRYLVLNPADSYLLLIGIDNALVVSYEVELNPSNLPPDYIPSKDSYYDKSLGGDY